MGPVTEWPKQLGHEKKKVHAKKKKPAAPMGRARPAKVFLFQAVCRNSPIGLAAATSEQE